MKKLPTECQRLVALGAGLSESEWLALAAGAWALAQGLACKGGRALKS